MSVAFEVFFIMDLFRVAKQKPNTCERVFPCGQVLCTNFSNTPCGRDKPALESNAITGINMFIYLHVNTYAVKSIMEVRQPTVLRNSVSSAMRLSVSDLQREGEEIHCCIGGWMYELEFLDMCAGRIEESRVHVQTNGAYLQLQHP